MKKEVIVSDDVFQFLDNLVDVLLKKEYFSYENTALEYVDRILDFTYHELPDIQPKATPKRLVKHGLFYTMLKANKRTAWYVFFNKKGNRYFIKHITNNHVAKAAFMKGLK